MNAKSYNIVINRSIKIIPSENALVITKLYAEKNLSKDALSLATVKNNHYVWNWGRESFVVLFEIPKPFNAVFQDVLRGLINYNLDYMKRNNLNDNIIYHRFMDNLNRKLIA